jgi:hypothetical protein
MTTPTVRQGWCAVPIRSRASSTNRFGGRTPAGVIQLVAGKLVDCDPDGTPSTPTEPQDLAVLAPNNHRVIYELPSSWTRTGSEGNLERDVGAFRDVLALLDPAEPGGNFADVAEVRQRAHVVELGVNAIELLPPADSPFRREWGYGTRSCQDKVAQLLGADRFEVVGALPPASACTRSVGARGIVSAGSFHRSNTAENERPAALTAMHWQFNLVRGRSWVGARMSLASPAHVYEY